MLRLRPLLFATLAALGCTEEVPRGQALREALAQARAAARPGALTPDQLGDADALRRVLGRDFAHAAPALGGVEYTVTHRARVVDRAEAQGDDDAGPPPVPVATLAETLTLRLTPGGDFSVAHTLAWTVRGDTGGQSGRRCWRVGDAYYTAAADGPATRVPVQVDEDARCLGSVLDPLRTLLDRVIDEVALSAGLPADAAGGRPVAEVVGVWRPRRATVPAELPQAYPRHQRDRATESYAIFNGPRRPLFADFTDLRGARVTARFDQATGLPVAADVEGTFAIRKLGKNGRLTVAVTVETAPFGAAIAAPEGARTWSPRPRPFRDQRALLAPLADPPDAGPDAALPKPGEAPALTLTVDEAELERAAALDRDAAIPDAARPDATIPDAARPDAAAPDATAPDAAGPIAPRPRDEDAPDDLRPPVRDEDAP